MRFGGLFSFLLLLSSFLLTSACVTYLPIQEYNLANEAVRAAKRVDASRYAPSLWYEAESTFRRAESLYRDRNYGRAQDEFVKARVFAERAESIARRERRRSGDDVFR